MEDKVIKDAMSSIKNIIRHVYDHGYEKGLKNAWECVRKMNQFNPDNNKQLCDELFDMYFTEFVSTVSPSEAIDKLEEYEEKQKQPEDPKIKVSDDIDKDISSDNKEDDTYVYLYKGTFSQVKKGNSVILSTDITYWDRNIHDDKVLKTGEIYTLKEYFPETGACLITINNEMLNKDRCKKCPNDHKCRLCLTGINWTNINR